MTVLFHHFNSFPFVESSIVHDNDTVFRQVWNQHLLRPFVKYQSIDTAIEQSYRKQLFAI